MLERLDKIEGVAASSANHTGTMIRVTVKAVTEREKLAAIVIKVVSHASILPALPSSVPFRLPSTNKTLDAFMARLLPGV